MTIYDLAFYIHAVKNNVAVVCLEDRHVQDTLAEVESTSALWRHESGVTLRQICEQEMLPDSDNVCPECWISWEVVEDNGKAIWPRKKQFYNVCQEAFWLAMHIPG